MRAEVGLCEGDGEGGICGEIELWIALAPVPVLVCQIKTERLRRCFLYFTTAIFTGAVTLAR